MTVHIYPIEIIALFDTLHELEFIYYQMESHASERAEQLKRVIDRNRKILRRLELASDNNNY